MRNRYIQYIIGGVALFILLSFSACKQDETCRKSRDVKMTMTLYTDSINPVTGRWVEQKITVETLTVQGVGIDSLILNDEKKVNSFKVDLDNFKEESQFVLDFGPIQDIITVRYKNKLEFLSMECGAIYTQTIDTAFTTGNFIDSITVVEPRVSTFYVENIKLHHIK